MTLAVAILILGMAFLLGAICDQWLVRRLIKQELWRTAN